MIVPIEVCPHCGDSRGFYTKDYVIGTVVTRYTFRGELEENGDMYEGLKHTVGKCAYCLNCNKRLFKVDY